MGVWATQVSMGFESTGSHQGTNRSFVGFTLAYPCLSAGYFTLVDVVSGTL